MPPHRTPTQRTTPAIAVGDQYVTDRHPTRSIDDIAHSGNLPYDVLSPIGFDGAFWYARLRHSV